jgi:hypothetical protein
MLFWSPGDEDHQQHPVHMGNFDGYRLAILVGTRQIDGAITAGAQQGLQGVTGDLNAHG